MRIRLTTILWLATASSAHAEWELALLGGWTAPTFEKTFSYRPEIGLPEIPGLELRQQGEFSLNARGSFAVGGSLTYYFNRFIGVEGRVDTVDFKIDTVAPRFTATADLPAPLPPLSATLDLGAGRVDVDRLFPLSANVRVRTGGETRFVASGGVTFLPRLSVNAVQEVGLGVTALGVDLVQVATVQVAARALPDAPDEGRWGYNAGAGMAFRVSDRLAITAEGRVYRFQKQTFVWTRVEEPTGALEEILLDQLENQLDPLELEPLYFQVTGGLVVQF